MNVTKQVELNSSLPQIQNGAQSLCSQQMDDKRQNNKTRRRRSSAQTVVDMGKISENVADLGTPREESEPAYMKPSSVLFKHATARRNSIAAAPLDKLPVVLTNNNLRLRKYSCPEMPAVSAWSAQSNSQNSQEQKRTINTGQQPRVLRSSLSEKPAEKDESNTVLEKSIKQRGEPMNVKQTSEKRRRSSTGTQPKSYGAANFAVEIVSPKATNVRNGKQHEEQTKQITDTRIHEPKTKLKPAELLPKLTGLDSKDDSGRNPSIKGSKDFGTFRENQGFDSVSTNQSLYSDSTSMTTFHEEIVSLFSYSSNVKKMDGLITPKPMANRGRSSIISWIKEVNSIQ